MLTDAPSTQVLSVGFIVRHRGQLLRRSWLDRPYGEEEITLLEEDVLPALKGCLARIGMAMAGDSCAVDVVDLHGSAPFGGV